MVTRFSLSRSATAPLAGPRFEILADLRFNLTPGLFIGFQLHMVHTPENNRPESYHSMLVPVHPGEVLRDEYLKALGLSPNALAKALHPSPSRIGDIVLERRER